jgi:glutathione S-transferase
VGNSVTLADFVVGGAVTYLERGQFPIAELPNLQSWWARLNNIPAWRRTTPIADLPN